MCSVIVPYLEKVLDNHGRLRDVKRFVIIYLNDDPVDTFYTLLASPPIERGDREKHESETMPMCNDIIRVYVGDVMVDLARVNPERKRDCVIIHDSLMWYLNYPKIEPEVARKSRRVVEFLEGMSE